jgi:hypothetical protein
MMRPEPQSSCHPPFVDALLGLVSICERSARLIEEIDDGASEPSRADGQLVHLLLGVVSFTETLRGHLSNLPAAPPKSSARFEEKDLLR